MNKTMKKRYNLHKPLVSVIIPTYNCVTYIPESIASVLDQSYKQKEIIVVDDGSTDNTPEAVKQFEGKVRYIRRANQGVSVARNVGINQAKGVLVVFLDADDIFLPGKLDAQVAVFLDQPDLDAVHSGLRSIDENGAAIKDIPWYKNIPVLDAPAFFKFKPMQLGAMMFKKDILCRVGGFKPGLAIAEDIELMFRLYLMGCNVGWLKQITAGYRTHGKSVTRKNRWKAASTAHSVIVDFFSQRALPEEIRKLENISVFEHALWWAAVFYAERQDKLMYRMIYKASQYSTLPRIEMEDLIFFKIQNFLMGFEGSPPAGLMWQKRGWKKLMKKIDGNRSSIPRRKGSFNWQLLEYHKEQMAQQ